MIEKRLNIQYGDSQQATIEEAIKSPLFIFNWRGPAQGKTTVINGIVSLFAETKWSFIRSQRLYAGRCFQSC